MTVVGFAVGAVCGVTIGWVLRAVLAREDRDAALRMVAFYRYQHEQALAQLGQAAARIDLNESRRRCERAWWEGFTEGEAFTADTYFRETDHLRASEN